MPTSTSLATISTRRGYGCQREVFHPLSERAEATAVRYYEPSDDEDEVGEVGNPPLPAGAVRYAIATPSSSNIPGSLLLLRNGNINASPTPKPTNALVRRSFVPKNPPMTTVARKDLFGRKGKGMEKRPVFLLDEMVAAGKPGVKAIAPGPPSTPPRRGRAPFSVLTPENTFGASSPFRARGGEREKEKEVGKENGRGYDYGSIPGAFDDDVDLHSLFEIPHDGTGLFDTQGSLLSFILFVASFAVEVVEFYMILFDLHEG